MMNLRNGTGRNQNGVVLVACLLMLLIVTVLGVSAFSDVNLQEKMAGNFRVKTRTFEATNASVQEQWGGLMQVQGAEVVTDVRLRAMDDEFDLDLDGDNNVDIDMSVAISICFNGDEVAPGTDDDYRAYLFTVTSDGSDTTGARSRVRQGGYIIAEDAGIALPVSC